MMLIEHLRFLGNRLFRWRSWTFLLAALFLILERNRFYYPFGSHAVDILFEMGCFGVSMIGIVIRGITIGHIPKGTSGRNTKRQKAACLNMTGLYSITRNPLYLGNYVIFLGLSLLSQSWEIVTINTFLFVAAYVPIILVEENFLLQRFDHEYRQYASRVPCLIPKPWLWQSPNQAWNWRMVLRREHDTFFAILLSFLAIRQLREYIIAGQTNLDWPCLIIGLVGAALWSTLKTLKRHTKLLSPAPTAG